MRVLLPQLGSQLADEYEAVLQQYFEGIGEAALEHAYELGRRALADGLGVLDMARLHHAALLKVSPPRLSREESLRIGEKLLIETLTPYEMTHRGFRESYAALEVSEERYRDLFENANDIVFAADLEGHLTSINRTGERLIGYARHEILSTHFSLIVAPECLETVRQACEATIRSKEEGRGYELEIVTKDGRRLSVEVKARLIHEQGIPVGVQGIARDITERKQTEHALRRLNTRLEEEATRIAHALHDEAGQMLASVYLAVAEVASELPAAAGERLKRISALLDQVTEQLRHLSHELRPIILDDLGLVPALEFLAQGIARRSGLVISIESSIDDRLPSHIETALYRILQEALTNVSRHAQATRACITLERNLRVVRSSIRDDGAGLDLTKQFPRVGSCGLGVIGIRERLTAIGGTLSITSGIGEGTTLEVTIPIALAASAEKGSRR